MCLLPFPFLWYYGSKTCKLNMQNKVMKNNFKNLKESHAYLQNILNVHVKFQKDRLKTVEGVARTMCILPIHFFNIKVLIGYIINAKKKQKIIPRFQKLTNHIFKPSLQHTPVKFQNDRL